MSEHLVDRVRRVVSPARAEGRRFLDSPHASVQLLALVAAGLLTFGLLMSTSTTIAASHEAGGAMWGQITKHLIFICIGLPVFWLALRLPPRAYRALAYPMLVVGLIVLVAVLIPGIGLKLNGSRRWLDLGFVQIQPSEFAKIAVLLWGADLLARKQQFGTLRRARHLFVPLLPMWVLVCGLVMLEPDLGTTLCFILILLGLLWMIGMPLKYFSGVLVMIIIAVTLLAIAAPYRLERLTTFVDPWKDPENTGFHTIEGLYALSSGGIFGVGLGQGTSKYGWVPHANTDYVFSTIGEELGLVGCCVVLALFALLAFTGVRIARRSADPFARLVTGAATVWLCGQAVINIGYVTGLLPVTGIPLPFISAGGTSLVVSFFVFGMLMSFARHEPAAVALGRRRAARNERTRIERWLRLPTAKPYEPMRRKARPPANRPVSAVPPVRRAPAAITKAPTVFLRPTGTDNPRGRR